MTCAGGDRGAYHFLPTRPGHPGAASPRDQQLCPPASPRNLPRTSFSPVMMTGFGCSILPRSLPSATPSTSSMSARLRCGCHLWRGAGCRCGARRALHPDRRWLPDPDAAGTAAGAQAQHGAWSLAFACMSLALFFMKMGGALFGVWFLAWYLSGLAYLPACAFSLLGAEEVAAQRVLERGRSSSAAASPRRTSSGARKPT